jgi:hypothetical protein
MKDPHNSQVSKRDDRWEYYDTEGGNVQVEDVTNAGLEEPRVAVSRYIPLIEYDSDEKSISITTKL